MGQCGHCWKRGQETIEGGAPSPVHRSKLSRVTASEGVQKFRQRAKASFSGDDQLLDAACRIVEALATGPSAQHAHLQVDAEVSSRAGDGAVTLTLHFGQQPLIAEIATRSRIAHNVRLETTLHFALCPLLSQDAPLVLEVDGLSLPALPEITDVRRRLQEAEQMQNAETAYLWWLANRMQEYPLKASKFHRVWESLWGRRCMNAARYSDRTDAFWGMIHAAGVHIEALEFRPDAKVGARVAARVSYASQDQDRVEEMIKGGVKALYENRRAGEQFAASAINWCALLYCETATQPGAMVARVVTLLSAAKWWGPAETGWQQFDPTWNCTDRTNAIGQVVSKQGRLLWSSGCENSSSPTAQQSAPCNTKGGTHTSLFGLVIFVLALTVVASQAFFVASQ